MFWLSLFIKAKLDGKRSDDETLYMLKTEVFSLSSSLLCFLLAHLPFHLSLNQDSTHQSLLQRIFPSQRKL